MEHAIRARTIRPWKDVDIVLWMCHLARRLWCKNPTKGELKVPNHLTLVTSASEFTIFPYVLNRKHPVIPEIITPTSVRSHNSPTPIYSRSPGHSSELTVAISWGACAFEVELSCSNSYAIIDTFELLKRVKVVGVSYVVGSIFSLGWSLLACDVHPARQMGAD